MTTNQTPCYIGFTFYFERPVAMPRLVRLKEAAVELAKEHGLPVRAGDWSCFAERHWSPEDAVPAKDGPEAPHPLSEFSTVFGDA